jgi:cupin superfamily acireductone dioxygenase involved in methionine salvage
MRANYEEIDSWIMTTQEYEKIDLISITRECTKRDGETLSKHYSDERNYGGGGSLGLEQE